MYLPVAPGVDPNPLKGLHNGWTAEHADYNRMVNRELDQLESLARSQKWDYRRVQQEVVALQTRLRDGFNTGRLTCA